MSPPPEPPRQQHQQQHQLRAVGFCGVDDSVHPHWLLLISQSYPLVEWGFLFRPDREGLPRYPSASYMDRLVSVLQRQQQQQQQQQAGAAQGGEGYPTGNAAPVRIKLAAHLCGIRVNEVLEGRMDFIEQLQSWGFGRVQINATAVNGVDTTRLGLSVPSFLQVVRAYPQLEFIIQKNEETRPLWEGLVVELGATPSAGSSLPTPHNISMLVDESKGTGVMAQSWPSAQESSYPIGYAGGIGPHNIMQVLHDVCIAAQGKSFWIDMESSLRSQKNGQDIFDLDKCYQVIDAICDYGLMDRPYYLPGLPTNSPPSPL